MKQILFPPEWHTQSAIQLTWPHEDSDWDYMLEEITACYLSIAREILKRQKLLIVCKNPAAVEYALGSGFPSGNLRLIEIASNDTWSRDHAPLTVFIDKQPALYDFTFNGWGLKFRADLDNQISRCLFAARVFSRQTLYRNMKGFVLEGGSIETDGQGALLTTSRCLLSPNRNPHLSKAEIEAYLKEIFGLKRVLWLDYGYLAGDDTDSHIDTLARFCDERTIAYVCCDDPKDEHFDALRQMEEQLKSFVDFEGNPYRLIPLPMAEKIVFDGERLPATYANFLIINGAVLVPAYQTPKDEDAVRLLSDAFPDREIVSLDCRPLVKQHGALHCIAMQYPDGVIS
ncbi:MAG: agmatine deiminase family protein [Prevotella sp.]|jgi:agmatine/peptidylarginine deiminase|nr:agmatine deiminase family protein [Prevotella sp.]